MLLCRNILVMLFLLGVLVRGKKETKTINKLRMYAFTKYEQLKKKHGKFIMCRERERGHLMSSLNKSRK